MDNLFMIMLYTVFIAIALILTTPIVIKRNKSYIDIHYCLVSLMMIGWVGMEIMRYLVRDAETASYIFSVKFAFLAFVPTTLFFLIIGCYRFEDKVPIILKITAITIPGFTVILALVNPYHAVFRRNVEVNIGKLTLISAENGVGYYVVLIYAFILIIASTIFIIKMNLKLPKNYRDMGRIMLVGLGIYALGFVLEFFCFKHSEIRAIDFNIVSITIFGLIFYTAIYSSGRGDYLEKWRHCAYHYFVDPVLILDEEDKVISYNHAAGNLFASLGVEEKFTRLTDIWARIVQSGKGEVRTLYDEDGVKVCEDLYIINNDYPTIYKIEFCESKIEKGRKEHFLIFADVTKNRLLIERLRDLAGVDGLTHLPNRYGLNQHLKEVDRPENLPLSVIVGDVNGLKQVNDRLGHSRGDDLIKEAAAIFINHTPKNGFVSRAGGDEFVVLLKNCDKLQAKEQIKAYEAAIRATSFADFRLSIALGASTKEDANENIHVNIKEADENMYTMKREVKARE
ncbi:diguanylate cyclase [Lachnospiraceae bacterium OttesenSCG-928-J05]|nr:diguanylate cyclase [Lachnospiraceae bacterium OttesenSCG-928-J05]